MGEDDEFDDEPLTDNAELDEFEKHLFAAIRESHKLDAEIDDEYRRLVNDEYDEPSVREPGVSDGDEP